MTNGQSPVPDDSSLRYQQLGLFVALYAQAEAMLRVVLREVVGIDKPTALAIFSGARTDQACSFIRRCYQARKKRIPRLLDAALARLAAINTFRNDLIHYTPDLSEAEPIVTNESASINKNAIRRIPFDSQTIYAHSYDLGVIILILGAYPDFRRTSAWLRNRKKLPPWLAKALEPRPRDRKTPKPDTRRGQRPRRKA